MNGARVQWGLFVLALVALVGVFVTYIVKGTVPDFESTLAIVLVSAVAGVTVPAAVSSARSSSTEPTSAGYVDGQG